MLESHYCNEVHLRILTPSYGAKVLPDEASEETDLRMRCRRLSSKICDQSITEARNRVLDLRKRLNIANRVYYGLDDSSPGIPDAQFDGMLSELKNLEKKFPILRDRNSITQKIGIDIDTGKNSNREVHEHRVPMLSLSRETIPNDMSSHDIQKLLLKWKNRKIDKLLGKKSVDRSLRAQASTFVLERKFDGLAVSVLIDSSGEIKKAVTRGDGKFGEDITRCFKEFVRVPLPCATNMGPIELRGEVLLRQSELEKFPEMNGVVRRNTAVGMMRLLLQDDADYKGKYPVLDFLVYSVLFESEEYDRKIPSHFQRLKIAQSWGFQIDDQLSVFSVNDPDTFLSISEQIHQFQGISNSFLDEDKVPEIEVDGFVIKINSIPLQNCLGSTRTEPNWSLALKFSSPKTSSVVEKVEFRIGRSGKITPLVHVEKVNLGGVLISKASLGSYDRFQNLNLHVGDNVAIQRSGNVIPHVYKNLSSSESLRKQYTGLKVIQGGIILCPCVKKSPLEKVGPHLYCNSLTCPSLLAEKLSHFCSKPALDVQGVGPKVLRKICDAGLIAENGCVFDLFEISAPQLMTIEGIGERMALKIVGSLERARNSASSAQILLSLSLPGVGQSACERILDHFDGKLENVLSASEGSLASLSDVSVVARNSLHGLRRDDDLVRQIRRWFPDK